MTGAVLGPRRGLRLARPGVLVTAWVLLVSTWGVFGTQLDLNGPPRPATDADIACGALFLMSVVAAIPIGAAVRRRRFVDLLWLAAVGTAAEEFWYVATMFASSDPASDTTAVGGVFLSAIPLYGLLLALLAAGMGLGRLLGRRQSGPSMQPTAQP